MSDRPENAQPSENPSEPKETVNLPPGDPQPTLEQPTSQPQQPDPQTTPTLEESASASPTDEPGTTPEQETKSTTIDPACMGVPADSTSTDHADDVSEEVEKAFSSMSDADRAELTGQDIVTPQAEQPTPIPTMDISTADSVEPGTEMTGTIATLTDDEIFLEFGPKSQGVLPRNQFGKKEPLEVGRRVDVVVEKFDPEANLLIVNRKGALARATWQNLTPGMIVEGRVTGLNKGGLEVDVNGLRAFMPASQVDVHMVKDISVLLNEVVRAEVLEVDRREKNLLISRRKYLQKELKEKKDLVWADLEVGQKRKGIVGNTTDFGAFVDLGGVDGLVHISDISWGQVDKVSDHLKTGDEVEVQVLKLDKKRNRISLGMKQVQPDPWHNTEDKYPPGTPLKARVVRLVDFGAFCELEQGVEALIPISEMGWTRVNKPQEVVSKDQMVDAVVIRCEPKKRRIALSIKQATPDPWASVIESYTPNSLVTGKVTRLTEFGAFVELTPGVEGLIHISELSEKHVKSASEVVQVGQEVESRVLSVDGENRRISLSIKAVTAPVEETAFEQPAEQRKPKKRKKPLRGGLSSHWDWEGDLKLGLDDVDK